MRVPMDWLGEWIDVEIPDEFTVDVFSDFGITLNGSSDSEFLLKARAQGEITGKTFLSEIKRRGVLADSVNVEDELDELEAEGPSFEEQQQELMLEQQAGLMDDEEGEVEEEDEGGGAAPPFIQKGRKKKGKKKKKKKVGATADDSTE